MSYFQFPFANSAISQLPSSHGGNTRNNMGTTGVSGQFGASASAAPTSGTMPVPFFNPVQANSTTASSAGQLSLNFGANNTLSRDSKVHQQKAVADLAKVKTENLLSDGQILPVNGPLNLTAQSYRGVYPFSTTDANARYNYYYNLGLAQQNSSHQATSYMNGFANARSYFQFPFANPAIPQLQSGHSGNAGMSVGRASTANQFGGVGGGASAATTPGATPARFFNPNSTVSSSDTGAQLNQSIEANNSQSRGLKPQHQMKPGAAKSRVKKSVNTEELSNRKRQEFEELAKAKTEKLLSDGPVLTTTSNYGSLASCSAAASNIGVTSSGINQSVARDVSDGPNYKKLIEAVLDAKKSALLRSPSVVLYLEAQQRSLANHKRQTELFCIGGKKC